MFMSEWIKLENKTWTPLHMEYISCHVVHYFMVIGCPFSDLSCPFTFFMIFGLLCACLGIKKAFTVYLILLGTWCAQESGLGYLSSGCLVRRLRTNVLGVASFTFGRGDRRLSPLFSTIFLIFNSDKVKYYLQAMETFLMADFSEDFSRSLRIWSVGYPRYRVMLGTSSYMGYLMLHSSQMGYLELYSSYVWYLKLCGVPEIILELCRVPRIILELCRVPRIILELCEVPQIMRVPWIIVELCGVSRIMRGTSGSKLDRVPQMRTVITWSYSTHRHVAFYYFSCFSPNNIPPNFFLAKSIEAKETRTRSMSDSRWGGV